MVERFEELNIDVDINQLLHDEDGTVGRVCHLCVSSLNRFDKLQSSVRQNVNDAIDRIHSGDQCCRIQRRKRYLESSDDETSVPHVSKNPVRTDHRHHCEIENDSESPDVAVS